MYMNKYCKEDFFREKNNGFYINFYCYYWKLNSFSDIKKHSFFLPIGTISIVFMPMPMPCGGPNKNKNKTSQVIGATRAGTTFKLIKFI